MEEQEEDTELFEHYKFVADPGQTLMRIDHWLRHKISNVSRNKIQKTMEANAVYVNDVVVRSNYRIKPNDIVTILLPFEPQVFELIAEDIPIDIVFEDESILIVNKAAGMVVHPGHNNETGTLVNAILYHCGILPQKDEDHRPGLVHRIDKDTTGLLVIGKTYKALEFLGNQFAAHTIHRRYLAIAWGDFDENEFTIKSYLSRNEGDRRKVECSNDPEKGKHAITHVKVLERYHFCSLIECRLETGRTHQIRAHLSSLGHPLLCDERYGGMQIKNQSALPKFKQFIDNVFKILPRQALHAAELGFIHPITLENVMFKQPLPADFEQTISKIRKYVLSKHS